MTNGFVLATDPILPPPGLERAVYAIGNFDGMHRGHQAVIERAVSLARTRAVPSAILTFEPHPADYFAGHPVAFRLTPPEIKARISANLGLSGIVFFSFDYVLASMSADEFIAKVLVARLGVTAVVVGFDFHFGKGRSGSSSSLSEAGSRYGFAVEIVAKVEHRTGESSRVVSSSAIRYALERGGLAAAASGLGRNYAISGKVISGRQLGRTLGVPTANITLEATNRLAHGIYAVVVRTEGRTFPGVASFGTRPTVDNGPPLLEVHLLDFRGNLYGSEIEVEFIERIREERKFESLQSLVAEMERDKERARTILNSNLGIEFDNSRQILNSSAAISIKPEVGPETS
jgi:riboflavin kinase/FMN adenylyltransferase